MEEARAVMRRLARIEALEREGADPRTILAEVRELLREGEAWLEAEGCALPGAAFALQRCHVAYHADVVTAV